MAYDPAIMFRKPSNNMHILTHLTVTSKKIRMLDKQKAGIIKSALIKIYRIVKYKTSFCEVTETFQPRYEDNKLLKM